MEVSSVGQDDWFVPVLGLDFQCGLGKNKSPHARSGLVGHPETGFGSGKSPAGEQRIVQGRLEISVSGSTLLFVPWCFVSRLGKC